jgi:predicted AAA+ superfamily ATPase
MGEIKNPYDFYRQALVERLEETAPGRIQLLTGPRQVGKTTLLLVQTAGYNRY